MRKIIIVLSVLVLNATACGQTRKTKNATSDTLSSENNGHEINYNNTKVLKTVYVVDRNGVEIRQDSDENSELLGIYEYGTNLDVIEETEKWLGIRERIHRHFSKDGKKMERLAWEKVYVLKNKTGYFNEIKLITSDLNIILSLSVAGQASEYFETGQPLNKYLKIELIDEPFFESKKSNAVDFLLADTTVIKKNNGTIELPCQDKVVKYVDKPDAEDLREEYHYVGQIEFLNQYLIVGSYWESWDYKFIDKTSGEVTLLMGDYPYISPDKQTIICICTNPYESTADLELYSISDNNIKHIMSTSFKNWMPTVDKGEMFWCTDGYLYLTVNHANSFWKEDGSLNEKCQYVRIKIHKQ